MEGNRGSSSAFLAAAMVVAMAMAMVFLPDKAARHVRRVLRVPGGPKVLHFAPGGIGKYIPWYMIPNVPDWEHGEEYIMVYDSQCSGEMRPCPGTLGSIYRGI